jgi:hypothetical protein
VVIKKVLLSTNFSFSFVFFYFSGRNFVREGDGWLDFCSQWQPRLNIILKSFKNSAAICFATRIPTKKDKKKIPKKSWISIYQGPIFHFLWYFSIFPVGFLLKKANGFAY